jgi:hypothetical protein
MNRLDKGNALHFLFTGFKKGDTLLQTRHVVHYSGTGITWITHPAAKRSSLVTVIEVESRSKFSAALAKTVSGPWRILFLARRREVAVFTRQPPTADITPIYEDTLCVCLQIDVLVLFFARPAK